MIRCLIWLGACVCFSNMGQTQEHPHIVVILVDDMGYGDPGCFNPDSKIETPHIDSLAAAGMRFTDAHAPGPLCHMSRYGLMTGRYPFRTNVGRWPREPLIDAQQTTIASLAKANGYRTSMVGKWHCGFDESRGYEHELPGGPVDRGFDTFFGIRASTDIPPYFYIRDRRAVTPPLESIAANASLDWSPIQGAFWRAGGIASDLQLEQVTPRFTREAIARIEQHASQADNSQPLLLYLAYPSPHTPWLPSEKFAGKSQVGLYGDFLMMVDDEIGQVLQALETHGLAQDTLVLLTSDNGPVWYEKDVKRFEHDSAGGLRGMKADAWEAGHRMPLIVRWPQVVSPGSETKQTICFTDVLATLADIWDAELPQEAGPDSFSFLPVLTGKQDEQVPIRGPIVMSPGAGPSMMMIREGNWKLIRGLGSGGFSKPKKVRPTQDGPAGQLYNLHEDPSEHNNLFAQSPDVVARLESLMQEIVESGRSRPVNSSSTGGQ